MPYSAPLHEMIRTLDLVGFQALIETGNFPHYDDDLLEPILDEANKLARDVIAPLNQVGHEHGAILDDGGVRSSPGFKEAFQAYRDGGWMGLSFPEEWGGQGLPKTLGLTVMEMINSANMAFGLCPMLSFGAIEAILAHGTDEQKKTYLPKLISADWTGTMNLTEPQAGSDVGALKTKAVPNSDGSYSITGQKIFITWGDHDLAENIIHLVLARTPGAPEGSKGISLFLCPKYLISSDGSSGEPRKCGSTPWSTPRHCSPCRPRSRRSSSTRTSGGTASIWR